MLKLIVTKRAIRKRHQERRKFVLQWAFGCFNTRRWRKVSRWVKIKINAHPNAKLVYKPQEFINKSCAAYDVWTIKLNRDKK